ncbi:MAG: type 1 glutamine amidotransferase [Thermodesulfovibrionales bacterium]|nr:type 1 glutamine amidotransferase [Thermodesulfovibrionales bacterium]
MRTAILKNISSEGPGTIAEYLDKAGLPYDVFEPEEVPSLKNLDGYDALVVLGGPMAVYEIDGHPQAEASLRLIKEALAGDMKVFGVCLGAQLLAHALGARVYKGKNKEAGWMDIGLTEEGVGDPVLSTLVDPGRLTSKVFQLHGDTFDIPQGATRLAGSEGFPNQAFKVGKEAYALQFHVEVTRSKVIEWAKDEPSLKGSAISDSQYEAYLERADKLYSRFFGAV